VAAARSKRRRLQGKELQTYDAQITGRADCEGIAMGPYRGEMNAERDDRGYDKISYARIASIVRSLCVRQRRRSIARAIARIWELYIIKIISLILCLNKVSNNIIL
jgi:hypothetical protein